MPQVAKDIEMTDDGDIVIDNTGDLSLATVPRTLLQDVQFRVAGEFFDFEPEPYLPANLSQFVGRGCTQQTADSMKEAVYYSLIRDGRFERSAIAVDVVPYDIVNGLLAIYIFIQDYVEDIEALNQNQYDQAATVLAFTYSTKTGYISRITGGKE